MSARKRITGLDRCKFCGDDISWSPKVATGIAFSGNPRTFAHLACYERWGWRGPTDEEYTEWRRVGLYPGTFIDEVPVDLDLEEDQ